MHIMKINNEYSNRYVDSERRFQHVLEACGVNKSLMKLGVKEGDTVIVGEVCCFYILLTTCSCSLSLPLPEEHFCLPSSTMLS